MASKRLQKEWLDLQKEPIPGISAGPEDLRNLNKWKATILGPADTPYARGIFEVKVTIPTGYPLEPPKVAFTTKIFHPNIDGVTGVICLDILGKEWTPALGIAKVLLSISSLLMDANPDNPSETSVSHMFRTDHAKFLATAKEWTAKFAL